MAGIKIRYEDKDILICEKPAGLAVQSARITEPDMVSELKKHLAAGSKGQVYLGIVHRLDQPVSGIMVFAKTKAAAAKLSAQVSGNGMQKIYRAAVFCRTCREAGDGSREAANGQGSGKPESEMVSSGTLVDYMVKLPGGGSRIAKEGEKDAKRAELSYQVLEQKGNRALLEISLKTGRHHQIRVQMSNAGMPLLGDARYGTEESMALSKALAIKTVQLQAAKLKFTHPVTGKRICYEMEQKLGL